MSERRELVPMSSDLSTEQKDLMIQMNRLVTKLFHQEAPLKPSLMTNGEGWTNLRLIFEKPGVNVSYMIMGNEIHWGGRVHLNLYLHLVICEDYDWSYSESRQWVDLSSIQTFWVCRRLQDNKFFMDKIRLIVANRIKELEDSAQKMKAQVDNDRIFTDNKEGNMIFLD